MSTLMYCVIGGYLLIGAAFSAFVFGITRGYAARARKEGCKFPKKTLRYQIRGLAHLILYLPLFWLPVVITGIGRAAAGEKVDAYEEFKKRLAERVAEVGAEDE